MAATEKSGTHTWAEQEAAIENAKTSAAMLAAIGMTSAQVAALSGANAPSGNNAVATMADIQDVPEIPSQANMPTSDQKAALGGTSGTPSASNPYATKATTDAEASARSSGDALALKIASNLSDLNNAATARTNLGLGNCDNTADANKPVSTAQATAITAQVFAEVALTNPYSATTPIVPRYIGDIAVNSTTLEVWQAQSTAAAATSWNVVSRGYYGGVVLTDAHAFNYNGFFSCLSTAANVPDATENWLFIQGNSNLGTTGASLLGIGLTTGQLRYQLKSASVWGAWTDKVTPVEISKLAGIGATTVKAQLDAKAPLASPALTGIPTAPTASSGTSNTQLATTAFSQRLKRRYGGHTGPLVAHRNYLNSTTWLSSTSAADNSWYSVCWSPELGIFCAVAGSGSGNRVMTSPDGVTWTLRTSPADNSWISICWSAELGLFCAVASSGSGNRVMTSPDGVTWTLRTSPADNDWRSVCWSPELGLFCAVANTGSGNRVMTSLDGITWTLRTSAADNEWYAVCWSAELGLFCAVAITGSSNRVMTSPDGITWTVRTSAGDNNWLSICWSAELGLFCAVSISGSGNRVMTSPDGITWTLRTSPADNQWRSVCWSPELGLFCAVAITGSSNRVMTSVSAWSMSYRTT